MKAGGIIARRAAGWIHAAQVMHRQHGRRDGQRRGEEKVGDQFCATDTNDGGDEVAAKHRQGCDSGPCGTVDSSTAAAPIETPPAGETPQ